MMVQIVPGKGATAHAFYRKDEKESINFEEHKLYFYALIDLQILPGPN